MIAEVGFVLANTTLWLGRFDFMKSGIITVVTLGILAWTSACAPAQPGSADHVVSDPEALRNGWILSLPEGQAQARKTAKPLMLVLRCNP